MSQRLDAPRVVKLPLLDDTPEACSIALLPLRQDRRLEGRREKANDHRVVAC